MNEICPLCKEADRSKVLKSDPKRQGDYDVWSCERCCYTWRRQIWKQSEADQFFGEASYTQMEEMEIFDRTKTKLFERTLACANESRPYSPRCMLDFGCSYGTLMQMFKDYGWQVMGIEISPTAQKLLDQRDLPWATCLEESGLHLQSEDIVIMFDAIYYLPDPVETLKQIQTYMKQDGEIIIRVPTRRGLIRFLSHVCRKKAFCQYMWGDFIHQFSRRSMKLTLTKAGFTNVTFSKEKGFKHSLKFQIIKELMWMIDCVTFRVFDLTLSWIVTATPGKR